MGTATYALGESPTIRINTCHGDMEIEGRQGGDVLVTSNSMPQSVQQSEGLTIEQCEDDLRLIVPLGATVMIELAEGDVSALRLAGLEIGAVHGELEAGSVRDHLDLRRVEGDARIRDTGRLTLGRIGGDLNVEAISGACTIQEVAGDVRMRDLASVSLERIGGDLILSSSGASRVGNVDGDARVGEVADLSLDRVGGDLTVERVRGSLSFRDVDGDARLHGTMHGMERAHVGGDLSLNAALASGETSSLDVDGDVSLSVPNDADLALHADVRGDVSGVERHGDVGPVDVAWGAGTARLTLKVGGDLNVYGSAVTATDRSVLSFAATDASEPSHSAEATRVDPAESSGGDPDLALLEAVARGELSPEEADRLLAR